MTDLHKMRADALAAKEQLGSKKPSRQKAYERLYAQYGVVTANHVSNCDPDTVLKLLDAVGAIAQPVTDAPSKDVILAALEEYRCTGHVEEDGDGARLVDMLTSGGTISIGISEVKALADFIWGAISDAQPVQPAHTDLQKAEQVINAAACEVNQDYKKCWRYECEFEGACIAPDGQPDTYCLPRYGKVTPAEINEYITTGVIKRAKPAKPGDIKGKQS